MAAVVIGLLLSSAVEMAVGRTVPASVRHVNDD